MLEKALAVHTGDEKLAKTLIGTLKKGEHGKPFIDGFSCFSISHTESIWAVLVADRECGLDIQLERKCSCRSIAERWFAPEDASAVAELSGKHEAEEFFRIWTRREALVKALGGTVYDPGLPGVLNAHAEVNGKQYSITDIEMPGKLKVHAAVCAEGRMPVSVSEIIDLEGLF